MRGHVDMDHTERQFDEARKEGEGNRKVIDELRTAKKMAEAMAAKLLVENSHLLQEVERLKEENAKLRAAAAGSTNIDKKLSASDEEGAKMPSAAALQTNKK